LLGKSTAALNSESALNTVDQICWPLAKSSRRILELNQAQRDKAKSRHKKSHQFLSEVGVKALRTYLGQLLAIAQISKSRPEYERHFKALFDEQQAMTFTVDSEGNPA
jgi:hypothetical protein